MSPPQSSFEQYERFTHGKLIWNDRYIDRLGRSNPEIASEIAIRFRDRYDSAIKRGLPIDVLTHAWSFAPTNESLRSFASAKSMKSVPFTAGNPASTAEWNNEEIAV